MDSQVLQSVDLIRQDGEPIDGLVSLKKPPKRLSPDEAATVRQAKEFKEVEYVFFRRFTDGRSSQPVAFVVDNRDERLGNDQLAKLHNDLWLHGKTPLVYVAWPTRIDILSCARGPDFWLEEDRAYNPAEQLEVASQVETALSRLRRFSAYNLADGTFWDDPRNHSLADHEKAAHESLIQAIVETDAALDGEKHPVLRRLLLLMVLIKYLEDRRVFPRPSWFASYHKGARSFFDVLKGGEPADVLRLLKTLEEKFNGDVFALPDDAILTEKSLRKFANLVEARTLKRQRYLWEQFSFAHIPVEVISHLYQRFVKGSTAVYTPPFLAALLLDYAMPYEWLTGKERVLDPACGSGVFLVGAYRRLVNVLGSKQSSKILDVATLKKILREQIFGVELDPNAIDLTAFSLALALCDCLQPNVIWTELRFDRLRNQNLIEADFFDYAAFDNTKELSREKFDVIVGNPPFESELTEPATRVSAIRKKAGINIPDKQIAYLFLDLSTQMLQSGGRLCLVQPSGFLYNYKAHTFRSFIAQTGRIESILDFTSIRGLFGRAGADPKTIAVVFGDETASSIVHLTFRRMYEATQHIGFELDHYDHHRLAVDEIIANSRAARANLLGGGRLSYLAQRLLKLRSIGEYVKQNKNWLMGEGFTTGHGGKPAKYLTGQPFLPTSALTDDGFKVNKLETVETQDFECPRQESLFSAPLVLIRENESLPMAYWDKSNLAFKHKIVAIHSPPENADKLRNVYTTFKRNILALRFAVAVNGSQALVGKSTALLKADIEALPFPEDESDLKFAHWEAALADDTLLYFMEYVKRGQNSELLKNAADAKTLQGYSNMFCHMLGSIYDNLQASEPVFLGNLICQPFFFGDEPAVDWLGPDCEEYLMKLVHEQSMPSLRTVRVVRLYHENVLFIIKPDRLRYWIRSTAIRDADDTLIELQQQGY